MSIYTRVRNDKKSYVETYECQESYPNVKKEGVAIKPPLRIKEEIIFL